MQIQNTKFSLFTSLTTTISDRLSQLSPIMTGWFSLIQQEKSLLQITLYDNLLLLRDDKNFYYYLELTFEIKLQILYSKQNDITSDIIGLRLFSQKALEIKLYGKQSSSFKEKLIKVINLKGFHQTFKPIKKLGKGNFATVYEAERITDKKRFAVKAFSKQNSYSANNGKESLINQLSLLRQLNKQPHYNVLYLQAVYQSDNSIYVVLELLDGLTLFQTIQNKKNLFKPEQVKNIMKGLLNGLDHIHKHRIMHRDLKPENIMIRKDTLDPVIVDFGLATQVDIPVYLFFRCGTPGYVAPQIIHLTQSIHIQPQCDIFSLGAIFHILLTKKPIFQGIKYQQVIKFDNQNLKLFDVSTIELLKKMLIMSAQLRIKAKQALNHSYFLQQNNQQSTKNLTVISPILTEASQNKKKKHFLIF